MRLAVLAGDVEGGLRGLREDLALADHKLPRRVVPIAVLPRNALGKVLRHELREAVGDD